GAGAWAKPSLRAGSFMSKACVARARLPWAILAARGSTRRRRRVARSGQYDPPGVRAEVLTRPTRGAIRAGAAHRDACVGDVLPPARRGGVVAANGEKGGQEEEPQPSAPRAARNKEPSSMSLRTAAM